MDRRTKADKAFEAFDFGKTVEDFDGWGYVTPGNEWSRTVFLENGETSEAVTFVVRFLPSTDEIDEAYVSGW